MRSIETLYFLSAWADSLRRFIFDLLETIYDQARCGFNKRTSLALVRSQQPITANLLSPHSVSVAIFCAGNTFAMQCNALNELVRLAIVQQLKTKLQTCEFKVVGIYPDYVAIVSKPNTQCCDEHLL